MFFCLSRGLVLTRVCEIRLNNEKNEDLPIIFIFCDSFCIIFHFVSPAKYGQNKGIMSTSSSSASSSPGLSHRVVTGLQS